MNKLKANFFFLLTLFASLNSFAQTWLGQLDYRNNSEYIRLQCSQGTCNILIPGLDGTEKHVVKGDPLKEGVWTFARGFETWSFSTKAIEANGNLEVDLRLASGKQGITFRKQSAPIDRKELYKYSGTFKTDDGQILISYPRRGFLRFESSFSERNSDLKPLGSNQFWSPTGELLTFSSPQQNVFQSIELQLAGEIYHLKRQIDVDIVDVSIPTKTDTLVGKLYLPDAPIDIRLPACVILPSAGSTTMSNNAYEAQWLSAHGLICLIFDRPGVGLSTSHLNYETASFEEKARLFHQVVEYLALHQQVNMDKVGLHGASLSGRLAIMMTMDRPSKIAFANAVSAPMVSQKEQQLFAISQFHRQRNKSEQVNADVLELWNTYLQGVIEGSIPNGLIEEINTLHASDSSLFLPPASTDIPSSPNAEDLTNNRILRESKKIKRPILLQYGEYDQRVDGMNSVYQLQQQAYLKRAVDIRFYPRANHSFITPEADIAQGYLNDKITWLRANGIIE